MWKTWVRRLEQWTRGERGVRLVVILGVAGMGLILLSGLLGKDTSDTSSQTTAAHTQTTQPLAEYCAQLQQQLAGILAQIDGVGRCQVLVQAGATEELVYVQDTETDQDEAGLQERRSIVVLSDDAGERALLQQTLAPEISGVVVVCQGADRPVVREHVNQAVQALLGLPANRICIVPAA